MPQTAVFRLNYVTSCELCRFEVCIELLLYGIFLTRSTILMGKRELYFLKANIFVCRTVYRVCDIGRLSILLDCEKQFICCLEIRLRIKFNTYIGYENQIRWKDIA